jgi:hypothetical protein
VEVDKDTIKKTAAAFVSLPGQAGYNHVGEEDERYRYDVDFRSTSTVHTDEFVVDDPMEAVRAGQIRIDELWTPVVWGDFDGKYNLWYKTNKTQDGKTYSTVSAMAATNGNSQNAGPVPAYPNTGYQLWAQDLDATSRQNFKVADLGLGADEHITAVRLEYGRVEVGFTSKNYADDSINDEHRTQSHGAIDLENGHSLDLFMLAEDEQVRMDAFASPALSSGLGMENEEVLGISAVPPPLYAGERIYTGGITGNLVDWTPKPENPFFAAGAAAAKGLQPMSYLVSAAKAMEDDEIVSSVTARIARNGMKDVDHDAVITVTMPTFAYQTDAPSGTIEGDFLDKVKAGLTPRTGDDFAYLIWALALALAIVFMSILIATMGNDKKQNRTSATAERNVR